jgi:hypothetical protein
VAYGTDDNLEFAWQSDISWEMELLDEFQDERQWYPEDDYDPTEEEIEYTPSERLVVPLTDLMKPQGWKKIRRSEFSDTRCAQNAE